jgi:hypothetical protein
VPARIVRQKKEAFKAAGMLAEKTPKRHCHEPLSARAAGPFAQKG